MKGGKDAVNANRTFEADTARIDRARAMTHKHILIMTECPSY